MHCHLYRELFEFETRSFVILFLLFLGPFFISLENISLGLTIHITDIADDKPVELLLFLSKYSYTVNSLAIRLSLIEKYE